jgi:lipid-A-disaccharide synthase
MPLRILISAGEVSGDVVAARVAREIRARRPDCRFYGLGGRHMADAGVELIARTTHLGAVGISEGAAVAPAFLRCWRLLRARIRQEPPAAALLIANDVFHLVVARRVRPLGIPVAAFFPPQVWIWRSVAGFIARSYDRILASFPEEEHVYRDAGGNVEFVGHYLVDSLSPVGPGERATARASLGLPIDAPIVGLLPGSRRDEVRRMAPAFLDAAQRLTARDPRFRFALPVADERLRPGLEREIRARRLDALVGLNDQSIPTMRAADLVLVASGTATLEAMLLQVPMVIAYRMSAFSYAALRACIAAGAIRQPFVGMPNLVLGRAVVPEFLQSDLTGASLAAEAWAILSSAERRRGQRTACAEGAAQLAGGGSLGRVADAVLALAPKQ